MLPILRRSPILIFSPGNVILEQYNSVTESFIREGIEPWKNPPRITHLETAEFGVFFLLDIKGKPLNSLWIQGFASFFLFNKWCHQQENFYLFSVDYHRFIVSSIWKSTWFSTRLCFIVLLAIRTILFSNISLFQYRLEFS